MSEEFALIRQQQVAKTRPEIFCVLSTRYMDVKLLCNVRVCFFSEAEAIKARDWLEKEDPIPQSEGWYEIEKSKLSFIEEN
jgi:hypothetical protein